MVPLRFEDAKEAGDRHVRASEDEWGASLEQAVLDCGALAPVGQHISRVS